MSLSEKLVCAMCGCDINLYTPYSVMSRTQSAHFCHKCFVLFAGETWFDYLINSRPRYSGDLCYICHAVLADVSLRKTYTFVRRAKKAAGNQHLTPEYIEVCAECFEGECPAKFRDLLQLHEDPPVAGASGSFVYAPYIPLTAITITTTLLERKP